MLKVRNIFIFILTLFLFFQTINGKGYAATSFKDIPSAYKSEIGYLIGKKIIVGKTGQSFRPKDFVTREEAVTMIGRAIGLNGKQQKTSFKDVSSKSQASGYIQSAFKKGLIKGYSNKTFKPKSNISRGDVAYLIAKAFSLKQSSNLSFKDVSKSNSQLKEMNQVVTAGIIISNRGSFQPLAPLSKQDYTLYVARGMNKSFRIPAIKPPDISKMKPIGQYTINATTLYVRQGPSTFYASVGMVKKNQKINVYETINGWAYMSLGNLRGYVSTGYLKVVKISNSKAKPSTLSPNNTSNTKPVEQCLVTADILTIRKGPGTKFNRVGFLKKNNKVNVSKISNGWAYVTYGSLKGYVSFAFLKVIKPSSSNAKTSPKPPITDPVRKPDPSKEQSGNYSGSSTNKIDQRIVIADLLNIRKGPGTTFPNLGVYLKKNNLVTVHNVTHGWAYISYRTLKGYVSAEFLKVVKPSTPKIIVIDAGHGGKDPGANGNGIVEKELNLSVSLRVQKLLEKAGIKVVMTRTGDTYPTLDQRNSIAAKSHADAFISIHANTSSSSVACGTESYYNSGGGKQRADQSKKLAGFIQNRLYKAINTKNRGSKEQDFRVIKYNPLTSVLIELGFLSNKDDAKKLKGSQYRDLAAQSIYYGILDFYKSIGK